jgi:anti-sigma regulatory factor (Ser/Thr protein kinase)
MVLGNTNGGGVAVLSRTLDVAATPDAPSEARRWLDGITPMRALGQVAFDVRLLVTELVANSVRHAGLAPTDQSVVTLELDDSRVRVEVSDDGPGFTVPARPQKQHAESGRGLQILAAIATRWGLRGAKPVTVWFEIDLERHRGPPALDEPRRPTRAPGSRR